MATRRYGTFDMNAAIEPGVNLPLDARQHVRSKEERLDPDSFNPDFIFKGMITASRDEEKLFFLVDHKNPTLDESWKAIGPYDDSDLQSRVSALEQGQGSGGAPATTLVAGTDVSLTTGTNTDGGLEYTVNAKQYRVFSNDPNIVIIETEV